MATPEQRLAELQMHEERHRLLAEHANDVIWTMGIDGSITYVSPAVLAMRGITPEEAAQQTLDQIHPPESMAVNIAYFERLLACIAAGETPPGFRDEMEYFHKDGSTIWTEVTVIPHLDNDGNVVEIIGVTRDIRERKRVESELRLAREAAEAANQALQTANAELERLATTDELTGLHNRRHCERMLARLVAQRRHDERAVSMLLFDLDHFKWVNDGFGHQVGDAVLVELTRRVQRELGTDVDLARWGGEEFVVVAPNTDREDAAALAERLRSAVAAHPFGDAGTVTISVGVAHHVPGETMDDWLRRADRALYAAKGDGRNTVCLAA